MQRLTVILILLVLCGAPAVADTATIIAGRDATLIEEPDGALANGSGPVIFVGRTGQVQNGIRRALLFFDVAGVVPRGALIESASLTLFLTPSTPAPAGVRVHRVLADWGEGPSADPGGSGAPSEPGDVTWIHRFYDFDFWAIAGGQFSGHSGAVLEVTGGGFYEWDDRGLVNDVRLWIAAPSQNFGWILIGDETAPSTAKRFAGRENADSALRPVLEVEYRLPGRP